MNSRTAWLAFALTVAADGQTLRVWGSTQMTELAERWERGFAKSHPRVRFDNHMYGAVSAVGGLYAGVADLVISREIWPIEEQAFEQVTGHRVTSFEVATGSFDFPTKSSALHVFVHQDNPVDKLTLEQLAAIFGAGEPHSWQDFGGKNAPIHTYGYKLDNAGAMLFANLVLKSSGQKWNCGFQGFGNRESVPAGQLVLDALARDPLGIAISNIHYARPAVKVVALAARQGGAYVDPTRKSTQDRTYPLTRSVFLFLNRAPGSSIEANLREFVAYVLSADGQRDVEKEGAYLPLPASIRAGQAERLH